MELIEQDRITIRNPGAAASGDFVLYWMQASQRIYSNPAFAYATGQANEKKLPLVVVFVFMPDYPEANFRHYRFMLQGIRELAAECRERDLVFLLRTGPPEAALQDLLQRAELVVLDRGYLRTQRAWRQQLSRLTRSRVVEVESDVIVPVQTASPKEEYSAATLRRKLLKVVPGYLKPIPECWPHHRFDKTRPESIDMSVLDHLLAQLPAAKKIPEAVWFAGGRSEGLKRLKQFVAQNLTRYAAERNDPGRNVQSNLSPYLHFGQISALECALAVAPIPEPATAAFLEELIVRRELAVNYVWYNRDYDRWQGIPTWAQNTLLQHAVDYRSYEYTQEELEQAQTHDPYWNAAQTEMIYTGKMHGYLRMYWGKKILEWSRDPEAAFQTMIYLNNKYELDGRDPSSYAGVAWCLGKHDRPWPERPIYGTVRSMTARGLERKFDIQTYTERIMQQAGEGEA